MNLLCLLNAKVTETNTVKLEFVDSNGEFQETVDARCKPYFFVEWSLKDEGKEIVKYFSGEIQPVEKIDLFSDTKRIYGKVYWPNARSAAKAAEKLPRHWENEVEFEKSRARNAILYLLIVTIVMRSTEWESFKKNVQFAEKSLLL